MKVKTILIIVFALIFIGVEVFLFDKLGTTHWLPWTLFLIPFLAALTPAVLGMIPKKRVVNSNETIKAVNPLEPQSDSQVSVSGNQSGPFRTQEMYDADNLKNRHEV